MAVSGLLAASRPDARFEDTFDLMLGQAKRTPATTITTAAIAASIRQDVRTKVVVPWTVDPRRSAMPSDHERPASASGHISAGAVVEFADDRHWQRHGGGHAGPRELRLGTIQ